MKKKNGFFFNVVFVTRVSSLTSSLLLVGKTDGGSFQVLGEHAVVAVNLRVAQVGHHRFFEAADFPLFLQLPGTQLVLGVLDYVLEREFMSLKWC